MTITEFLEARIAEDEEAAHDRAAIIAEWERSLNGATGSVVPDLVTPERLLAECAAKRAIIASVQPSSDWDYYAAEHVCEGALRALATPYATHHDYQPEWAPRD